MKQKKKERKERTRLDEYLKTCCPRSIGLRTKNFKLVWRQHLLLSGPRVNCHLQKVLRQSRLLLMIGVIMRCSRGPCTDVLAFTLQLRKTPENRNQQTVNKDFATSHRLKWGPLTAIEVCAITQSQKRRKKERRGTDE